MPASQRWSVQIQPGRPAAVLLGGVALALTAAAGAAASAWMQGMHAGLAVLCAAAALAFAAWRSRPCVNPLGGSARRVLSADAAGGWSLCEAGIWREVAPARVWRGPGWVTLMLAPAGQATAGSVQRRTMTPGSARVSAAVPAVSAPSRPDIVTLTLWRGAVPAESWRKLCVLLRARPMRAARGAMAEAV